MLALVESELYGKSNPVKWGGEQVKSEQIPIWQPLAWGMPRKSSTDWTGALLGFALVAGVQNEG